MAYNGAESIWRDYGSSGGNHHTRQNQIKRKLTTADTKTAKRQVYAVKSHYNSQRRSRLRIPYIDNSQFEILVISITGPCGFGCRHDPSKIGRIVVAPSATGDEAELARAVTGRQLEVVEERIDCAAVRGGRGSDDNRNGCM